MTHTSISVAATFTAEPLAPALQMWLDLLGDHAKIQFNPFNQVIQSLVDPRSRLCHDSSGLNVLLIRLSDWVLDPSECELRQKLHISIEDLANALTAFSKQYLSPCLVLFCPEDVPESSPQQSIFQDAELEFAKRFNSVPGVAVYTNYQLQDAYPIQDVFDSVAVRTGRIPYTDAFFVSLGTQIARHWYGLRKHPTKVIVLDCDNTIWNGVCGEVGSTGVSVDPEQQIFQQHLISWRDKGYLLALCSKNSEADVWSVFDQNPKMILKREHISAAAISWQEKSTGLQRIAAQLGLSTDSMLFIDDNPLEVAEVRANLPAAVSLQLPSIPEIPTFLNHLWPLDQQSITRDDQIRAASYQLENNRIAERSQHLSIRTFIENLNLKITFKTIDNDNLARAAQLIERTNQFNLTLKRRSVSELQQFLSQPQSTAFLVDVADKFGDYGIVGIGLCTSIDDHLQIDTMALSCRALGRGVEYHMLRHLGDLAKQLKLARVTTSLVRGERNEPAGLFLKHVVAQIPNSTVSGEQFSFSTDQLQSIITLDLLDTQTEAADVTPQPASVAERTVVKSSSELLNQIANELHSVSKITQRLEKDAKPRPELKDLFVPASTELEQQIAKIVCKVLRIKRVGIDDQLTQLGASSLQLVQIHSRLVHQLEANLSITELYNLPTIAAIAQQLDEKVESSEPAIQAMQSDAANGASGSPTDARPDDIAVIGMAGRFPGADSVEELWQNLIREVNCIVPLTDDQLNLASNSPLRTNPNLVRRSAAVRNAEYFDAKFFGIFPKEAKVMDPQHRLMLECCWTALEDAGYCPDKIEQSVGVFAGCYMDTYILASLQSNPELLQSLANSFHGGDLLTELGNDKDYLATRISFQLNLRGPAMTIQTACSTSLVAIIQACQALQNGHCDMALAGGATFKFPQRRGYLYAEGGMVSPDGICRPFDAEARGTVFGEGIATVVLKRLDHALRDGDEIYSVIRGWGINNDGRSKMAYTAPSVNGQSAAIEMAHQHAGFSADTISYVEAHGTGTSLGDPIEVDSLTKAFRKSTDKKQYCGIGSVKSNIGHLDVAAGVTGLIKICLAMRNQQIPPSINFNKPNPNIDFANSPFYVVNQNQTWISKEGQPRRAGLSSFGVGGTNAHIVVQEPPIRSAAVHSKPQLLILSARSATALDTLTQELGAYLANNPQINSASSLTDIAYTLQMGRKEFVHKRVLVANDIAEASRLLLDHASQPSVVLTQNRARRRAPVDFVFPGQGSQHLKMAFELYQSDELFRSYFDQCVEILKPLLNFDLREKLFADESDEAVSAVNQTSIAQPAIFSASYALAKRLEHLGIKPQRMVGHSVGEFVAACLAGVFSLEDGLRLIFYRANQMQALPAGAMVAVRIKEEQLVPILAGTPVEIAAINSPELCVITGPTQAVHEMQSRLESENYVCRSLHTSHAFHSQMMDPVIEPFADLISGIKLSVNQFEIISSVTGKPLTPQQAIDPAYWSRHLRETVRFTDAINELLKSSDSVILEVGPGQALSTLVRQNPTCIADRTVLSIQPHAKLAEASFRHWLLTIGRLWQAGVAIQWDGLKLASRRRVHLPTYPFERQRYWFDEVAATTTAEADPTGMQQAIQSDESLPPQVNSVDQRTTPMNLTASEPDQSALQEDATAATSVTEQVIRQQLQLMRQQLELWRR